MNWTLLDERWSVGFYGRNLANRKYFGQNLYLAGAFDIASVGAPLEFGLDMKFKW